MLSKGQISVFKKSSGLLTAGKWTHICLTHRRSRIRTSLLSLYVDGRLCEQLRAPYCPLFGNTQNKEVFTIISLSLCMCVFLCECVFERERERERECGQVAISGSP